MRRRSSAGGFSLACLWLFCLLLTGCTESAEQKLGPANLAKIAKGMSEAEVEKILGKHDSTGTEQPGKDVQGQPGLTPTTGYPFKVWQDKTVKVTVYFDNGKVHEIVVAREGAGPVKAPKSAPDAPKK